MSPAADRMLYASLQVAVGLAAPAIYASNLTTFSFATASLRGLAYWIGIPAATFLLLAALSLLRRGGQFRLSNAAIWGAAVAGYLAFLVPAALLLLTSGPFYRGGGANIGVAILVVGMPVCLPIAVAIGFASGEVWGKHKKGSVPS